MVAHNPFVTFFLSCPVCVGYRRLNDLTYKDSFPIPRIDTCLDALRDSVFFSTMDLLSGFWQVAIDHTTLTRQLSSLEMDNFVLRSWDSDWQILPAYFSAWRRTPWIGQTSQTSIILKLTYLGRVSSDFHKIWHDDAVRPSRPPRPLKIWNFWNPRWRPAWKIDKSRYFTAFGPISTKFGTVTSIQPRRQPRTYFFYH